MRDIKALRRVLEYASVKDLPRDKRKEWPSEVERRGAPRHAYSAEGTGTLIGRQEGSPLDIEPEFPVIMLSLSRGGTGFLANEDLRKGDVVELTLPAARGATKKLITRVVRSKRAGLNAYQIGSQFTKPPT